MKKILNDFDDMVPIVMGMGGVGEIGASGGKRVGATEGVSTGGGGGRKRKATDVMGEVKGADNRELKKIRLEKNRESARESRYRLHYHLSFAFEKLIMIPSANADAVRRSFKIN